MSRGAFEKAVKGAKDPACLEALANANKRLQRLGADLAAGGHAVLLFRMKTSTRLITGSGGGLPEVNATAVDPAYGFPHLPGSSLKGAARAEAGRQSAPGLLEIFGGAPAAQDDPGSVRFFTAVPVRDPNLLELDTATVHHQGYYEGRSGPAPTEGSNPVPLLVVPAGREFRFLLAALTPSVDQALVVAARDYLTTALSEEGLGAATSSGYGYFNPTSVANEKSPA